MANINILGVGIDIVEINRFSMDSAFGSSRIFCENEQKYLQTNNKHVESMAGLFAAKEAVVKALGTGFRGFFPSQIEISHNSLGKPNVILHGNAKLLSEKILKNANKSNNPRRRYRLNIDVSISHNKTTAIAIAVVSYSYK